MKSENVYNLYDCSRQRSNMVSLSDKTGVWANDPDETGFMLQNQYDVQS